MNQLPTLWVASQPYNQLPALQHVRIGTNHKNNDLLNKAYNALKQLNEIALSFKNHQYLTEALCLYESLANSEIENIYADLQQLQFLKNVGSKYQSQSVQDIIGCYHALLGGLKQIERKPVISNTAIIICEILKGTTLGVRKTTGTAIKSSCGEIVYTPPEGEGVIWDHLSQWEKYLNENTDTDPLIRMITAHYQFEAIHPFIDGNGRTGRILNQLFLIDSGLMRMPVLCMSYQVNQNLGRYYSLLRKVTSDNAWDEWIEFMLELVVVACAHSVKLIEGLKLIEHQTEYDYQYLKMDEFLAQNY